MALSGSIGRVDGFLLRLGKGANEVVNGAFPLTPALPRQGGGRFLRGWLKGRGELLAGTQIGLTVT